MVNKDCKICGSQETVSYRHKCLQYLCIECYILTPKKVSKPVFKQEYFKGEKNIQQSIVNEFYDDYITSIMTLKEYIKETAKDN